MSANFNWCYSRKIQNFKNFEFNGALHLRWKLKACKIHINPIIRRLVSKPIYAGPCDHNTPRINGSLIFFSRIYQWSNSALEKYLDKRVYLIFSKFWQKSLKTSHSRGVLWSQGPAYIGLETSHECQSMKNISK